MGDRTLLGIGIIGSITAALCCFTPILVVLLGAVGLSAWLAWLDYVLLPALVAFLGLTVYGLYRWRCSAAEACAASESTKAGRP